MVLTATAVSMMAGKTHAHAGGVPVWISRSRRVRKAEHECARTDGGNRGYGPAVNPAGGSGTDGEGDAVHGGEESDGRHSSGTDLYDDAWDVGQHRVRDIADEADRGRADQEVPEEPDSTVVVPGSSG
jgi:hypothetical protein